jgi:hypothetical protein
VRTGNQRAALVANVWIAALAGALNERARFRRRQRLGYTPVMSEFELSYRTAAGPVTRVVTAVDADAAELQAPLEAEDITVRPRRRIGASCRPTPPPGWPIRR